MVPHTTAMPEHVSGIVIHGNENVLQQSTRFETII
jgi:hypothetical protein